MLQNPMIELKKSFNYFLLALKNYAQFSGRATRSEYWYFYVFSILIDLVINLLGFALKNLNSASFHLNSVILQIPEMLDLFLMFFLLVPSIAIACRRLHDRNLSGWFQILEIMLSLFFSLLFAMSFVSIFYETLSADAQQQEIGTLFFNDFFATLASTLSGLAFYSQKGTLGDNRFGKESLENAEAPLAPAALSVPITAEEISILEKMLDLREKGILTEEEFQDAKMRVLK
ncbi:DUF805 domain-containing protein [Acetobacteraceae bacterium]|nr:DUF805 domain-containing protein [Acetobacteraceae bacterium]